MTELLQTIRQIREKLPDYLKHHLSEIQTRTILITPLLKALGWNVLDPAEVREEYPTVDGKFVDYALMVNGKPLLLVEAKPLDDPLEDVKAITQVVGYAASDGIVWCILTNGVKWRVYSSVEKCEAPDKLLFEVNLDPDVSEEGSVEQIAKQMWLLSRGEVVNGTLDNVGEQFFTERKVRKALLELLTNPTQKLFNLIRDAAGEKNLTSEGIKKSLTRIADEIKHIPVGYPHVELPTHTAAGGSSPGTTSSSEGKYNEAHHLSGKSEEVKRLLYELKRICTSIDPSNIEQRCRKHYIGYYIRGCSRGRFCCVEVFENELKVYIRLRYKNILNPPYFAHEFSLGNYWGPGYTVLYITSQAEFEQSADLIRRSFHSLL